MTIFSRATGSGRAVSEVRRRRPSLGEGTREKAAFHARLGADLYRRRLYARAAQEFRWSLAADPGSADVHNHLAITLNAQGQYEEAVGELRLALMLSPNHAEAARNLARTLSVLGLENTTVMTEAPQPGRLPN